MNTIGNDIMLMKKDMHVTKDDFFKIDLLIELINLENSIGNNYYKQGLLWLKLFLQHKNLNEMIHSDNTRKKEFLDNYYTKLYTLVSPLMCGNKAYYNSDYTTLNEAEIMTIFEKFIQSLGSECNAFYQNLKKEQRIVISNKETNSNTMLLPYNGKSYIFLKKLTNLYDATILAHEFGHSYSFYVNNNKLEDMRTPLFCLKSEMPSSLFELMFINFLLTTKKYYNDAIGYLIRYNNRIIGRANKIRQNSGDDLLTSFQYLLGEIYAKQILLNENNSCNIQFKDICLYLNNVCLDTLINDIPLNYDVLKENINKESNLGYQKCLKKY